MPSSKTVLYMVKRGYLRTKKNKLRIAAIFLWCHPVRALKSSCESLMGRETIFQSNIQNSFITIAYLFQRKSQSPEPQIISKMYAGNLFEFSRRMKFRITQLARKTTQCQSVVIALSLRCLIHESISSTMIWICLCHSYTCSPLFDSSTTTIKHSEKKYLISLAKRNKFDAACLEAN